MKKKIFITGATDGIGFEAAKMLAPLGHNLLLHGRSPAKLEKAKLALSSLSDAGEPECYLADFSNLQEVEALAKSVLNSHDHLDVLINNAGVFVAPDSPLPRGLDIRFVVNTFAPYLLSEKLLPVLDSKGRIINLSSAAQSSVDISAMSGNKKLTANEAYAQSKLALTMWSRMLAKTLGNDGPAVIAVNPASMLGSKMVNQAYGVTGKDISIGADILMRAALDAEFASATGKYFDNDIGHFRDPHPDALRHEIAEEVMAAIIKITAREL